MRLGSRLFETRVEVGIYIGSGTGVVNPHQPRPKFDPDLSPGPTPSLSNPNHVPVADLSSILSLIQANLDPNLVPVLTTNTFLGRP